MSKINVWAQIQTGLQRAKAYAAGLVGELAGMTADALEELEGKLKQVAYTGSYNDLSDTPESMKNPNALTITMNGTSTAYDGSTAQSKTFYAPTSYGAAGRILVGTGSNSAPVWQGPPYATCSTGAATVAKTPSVTNFKLTTGVIVRVKFTYAHNTTTAATLNISSTGAKTIVVNVDGVNKNVTRDFTWSAGEIVTFLYDGTYWVAIDSNMGFVHPTNSDIADKADKSEAVAVTIPVSGWSDDGLAGFPKYYDIEVTDVTAADRAEITIAVGSLGAAKDCGLCPTNETIAGKIRIRAENVPTEAIAAEYWIEKGKG